MRSLGQATNGDHQRVKSFDSVLPRISTQTAAPSHLLDSYGRVRLFHGICDGEGKSSDLRFNATSRNFLSKSLMNETLVRIMTHDMNLNVARVLLFWGPSEPVETDISDPQYDEQYLEAVRNITQSLAENGMYSILDMHQDCFTARQGVGYDGVPRWLADKVPLKDFERYPFPVPGHFYNWGECYFSLLVNRIAQALYNNDFGMRDRWASFWQHLATLFRKDTNILGYELLNEPWVGNIYADPLLLLPGHAGAKNLQPSFDAAAAKLREADEETIVFYSPNNWGIFAGPGHGGFPPAIVTSGYTHVPPAASEKYKSSSVFSFHYYCWAGSNWRNSTAEREVCERLIVPRVFEAVKNDVARLGGGRMLTEWAGAGDYANASDTGTMHMNAVMRKADEEFVGWTYFGIGQGATTQQLMAFARPYAQAVAGIPISQVFNWSDYARLGFELEYEAGFLGAPLSPAASDVPLTLPETVVALPRLLYGIRDRGISGNVAVDVGYHAADGAAVKEAGGAFSVTWSLCSASKVVGDAICIAHEYGPEQSARMVVSVRVQKIAQMELAKAAEGQEEVVVV